MRTVDWDGHVTAVLAEWVLRWIMPPDRDECAWKHVLHHMVLVDRQGYDKFPEGRNIMLCRMTPADKLRVVSSSVSLESLTDCPANVLGSLSVTVSKPIEDNVVEPVV